MNKLVLGTLLLAFSAAAPAASVFECTDGAGRKVYTQTGGKNCKQNDLGKPSVYTSAAPSYRAMQSGSTAPEQHESANRPADDAQRALAQAQKNLEEGKQVRYGNERNYARYQERIKGLENQVKAAQDRVNASSGNASSGALDEAGMPME